MKYTLGDKVRVSAYTNAPGFDIPPSKYVGREGVVYQINSHYPYPYTIAFVDNGNEFDAEFFDENELEAIE